VGRGGLALAGALAVAACGRSPAPARPAPARLADRVVADFERAVLTSKGAFVGLFDFDAVGRYEILLRRVYYLEHAGDMDPAERAGYERDDGTPYPAARERRNVGNFYPLLAQRTVGTGGCRAAPVAGAFNRRIARAYPPLPAGSEAWEPLRARVNRLLAAGGAIDLRCAGGAGALTLVWTTRSGGRGYDLITIYDDPGD